MLNENTQQPEVTSGEGTKQRLGGIASLGCGFFGGFFFLSFLACSLKHRSDKRNNKLPCMVFVDFLNRNLSVNNGTSKHSFPRRTACWVIC